MKETNLKYEAYTDGSCDNISPYGEGGSAYIILKDGVIIKESKKGFVGTTNNRMEMLAIISAVKSVPKGATLTVYTDSQYCIVTESPIKSVSVIIFSIISLFCVRLVVMTYKELKEYE